MSTGWRTPAKRSTQFEPTTYGLTSSLTPAKRPSLPTYPDFFTAEEHAVPRLMPVLIRLQILYATMSPMMTTSTTTSTTTSAMSSTASLVSSTTYATSSISSTMGAMGSNTFAHRQVTPEELFYSEEDFETETHFKCEGDTE